MRAFLIISLLIFGACNDPKSQRCKSVCQQESDCAEQRSRTGDTYPYSRDECVAACVSLERDKGTRVKVDKHVECAKKAQGDCDSLLQCHF